jgi:hypothetical protein
MSGFFIQAEFQVSSFQFQEGILNRKGAKDAKVWKVCSAASPTPPALAEHLKLNT